MNTYIPNGIATSFRRIVGREDALFMLCMDHTASRSLISAMTPHSSTYWQWLDIRTDVRWSVAARCPELRHAWEGPSKWQSGPVPVHCAATRQAGWAERRGAQRARGLRSALRLLRTFQIGSYRTSASPSVSSFLLSFPSSSRHHHPFLLLLSLSSSFLALLVDLPLCTPLLASLFNSLLFRAPSPPAFDSYFLSPSPRHPRQHFPRLRFTARIRSTYQNLQRRPHRTGSQYH